MSAPLSPYRLPESLATVRRGLLCAGVIAALAGCAPVPFNPDTLTAAPEPGLAIVIGWGNTVGENARAAMTPEQGDRVSRAFVAFVNNRKISIGENIVRLTPGEYDLTISCGIYRYYRFFTDEKTIHVTLAAGHVYRLRPDMDGRRCEPSLDDVMGKGS
jgi:hypothetical protein